MTLSRFPKTQYLGSKQNLVEWIGAQSPKSIQSVADVFSGTSCVGYYFKERGKNVYSNDFLSFNYHIANALIVNKSDTLDDTDIVTLFSQSNHGNLVDRLFTGIFFEQSESILLDQFRANINQLPSNYKQSLAFSVMGRALTRKIPLGHFAHASTFKYVSSPERVKRNPSISKSLKSLFMELLPFYNAAVFDNQTINYSSCQDAVEWVSTLRNVDLAYYDPPYCGCHPDYQAFYHLLETYNNYDESVVYVDKTNHPLIRKPTGFIHRKDIESSLDELFGSSLNIPYWLVSYNSKSYPSRDRMIALLSQYRNVDVQEHQYKNNYGGKGSRHGTVEYLFFAY